MAEEYENIMLDASGVVFVDKIKEAVDRIGSSRIMFGIDGPHELPDTVTYARNEIEKIRKLNLSPQDESAILGENIAFLIGI